MFKPKRLSKTVIIGSKLHMEKTIELLHGMELAHIIDYVQIESDQELKLGFPAEKASNTNEKLLKLRSSAKMLELEKEPAEHAKMPVGKILQDMDSKLFDLEQKISFITEEKAKIEEDLTRNEEIISQLRPFTDIDIPLENYQGYENLVVFTGHINDCEKLEDGLAKITDEYELFNSNDEKILITLFVYKTYSESVSKILAECGYSEIKAPQGTGLPKHLIEECESKKLKLLAKIEKFEADLIEIRKKHAEFILASEEYLSIEVQKAEAPVRFATTTHSFVIDCWIPKNEFENVKNILEKETEGSLYIEELEVKFEDEPPVLLDNPKQVKPFEFLLDLYSTPNYREIDPSFILSLIFPLFFGFMIGDLGYGILLIIFGYIFIKKFKGSEGLYNIGFYIIIAGIFASIFGLFLFGDMLGLTFQSPLNEPTLYSWSGLLGVTIPISSIIHKTETSGVTQLLVLSIIAGYLHLGLGLIFGALNERKHSIKHAISKIGLIFVLTAFVLVIFVMADWTISQWLQPLKNSAFSSFLWPYVISPLKAGIYFSGLLIPYATIVLIIIGLIIIVATIGAFGLIEMLEVASHLMSYTRLAAIGVAKGALAFSFNVIGLGMILSGNVVIGLLGVIALVFLQLLVFALGSLSSGIQALRLHYVEFFMKFYKGGGIKFTPFKYVRKYTTT
jgi:V/A-type H+-transporting ATPase subunit I